MSMFTRLGDTWDLSEENLQLFEEFVCHLYGGKGTSVDNLRYKKFEKVFRTKSKIEDLSLLPPCRRSLILHLKRANYTARIWKLSLESVIDFADIKEHGWNTNGTICWTTDEFPDDILEILCKEENDDVDIDEPEYTSEDEEDE